MLAAVLAMVIAAALAATIIVGQVPVVVRPIVAILAIYLIMAGIWRWYVHQTEPPDLWLNHAGEALGPLDYTGAGMLPRIK